MFLANKEPFVPRGGIQEEFVFCDGIRFLYSFLHVESSY